MPTYDYVCDECGYHFDKFQSITAEPLTKCPKCQGKVRRLISAGNGFLFKGSGFYITDHRSKNYIKDKQKAEGISSSPSKSKTPAKIKSKASSKTMAYNSVKKAE